MTARRLRSWGRAQAEEIRCVEGEVGADLAAYKACFDGCGSERDAAGAAVEYASKRKPRDTLGLFARLAYRLRPAPEASFLRVEGSLGGFD